MAIRSTKQNIEVQIQEGRPREAVVRVLDTGRLRRSVISSCLGAIILATTGCSSVSTGFNLALRDFQECIDDSMIDYRNRTLAEKAWIRVRHQYCDYQYHRDFKDGFVAGYMNVAAGGNGCCPTLAPSQYWGWKYQSPYGQAAVNAWFEGYPLGAKAGEQDGIGFWQSIRMDKPASYDPTLMGAPTPVPMAPSPIYGSEEVIPMPPAGGSSEEPGYQELPFEREFEPQVEIIDPQSVFDTTSDGRADSLVVAVPDDDVISELSTEADVVSSPATTEEIFPPIGPEEFSDEYVNELFAPDDSSKSDDGNDLPFSFE